MAFHGAAFVNFMLFLRGVWFVKQPAPEPYICQRYIDHPYLVGGQQRAGSWRLSRCWGLPHAHIPACVESTAFSSI